MKLPIRGSRLPFIIAFVCLLSILMIVFHAQYESNSNDVQRNKFIQSNTNFRNKLDPFTLQDNRNEFQSVDDIKKDNKPTIQIWGKDFEKSGTEDYPAYDSIVNISQIELNEMIPTKFAATGLLPISIGMTDIDNNTLDTSYDTKTIEYHSIVNYSILNSTISLSNLFVNVSGQTKKPLKRSILVNKTNSNSYFGKLRFSYLFQLLKLDFTSINNASDHEFKAIDKLYSGLSTGDPFHQDSDDSVHMTSAKVLPYVLEMLELVSGNTFIQVSSQILSSRLAYDVAKSTTSITSILIRIPLINTMSSQNIDDVIDDDTNGYDDHDDSVTKTSEGSVESNSERDEIKFRIDKLASVKLNLLQDSEFERPMNLYIGSTTALSSYNSDNTITSEKSGSKYLSCIQIIDDLTIIVGKFDLPLFYIITDVH